MTPRTIAACLVIAFVAVAQGRQSAPWFGTWEQVLPPPARFETPPYRRVTTRIEPWDGDGIRVTYDMVRARGGITHIEWEGRFDGRDYPVQGVDYVLTNAYRIVSDSAYVIDIKVDGRTAATATAVVSADGRTLTVTTVERRGGESDLTTTALYRRR